MGLPPGLVFRTKGQLAMDLCAEVLAGGVRFDFVCGDEVYGNSPGLRSSAKTTARDTCCGSGPAFTWCSAGGGPAVTCAQAARALGKDARRWEVRSAGAGSKGARWYGWALLATASPHHHLLIRRHLTTAELAFHYCFVPEGQPVTRTRLIRAAGLRWPGRRRFRVRQGLLRPG